jgi:hypothetical protein
MLVGSLFLFLWLNLWLTFQETNSALLTSFSAMGTVRLVGTVLFRGSGAETGRSHHRRYLCGGALFLKNGGTEKESFLLVVIALMVQDSFSSPPHVEARTQQVIPVRRVPGLRAYAGPRMTSYMTSSSSFLRRGAYSFARMGILRVLRQFF